MKYLAYKYNQPHSNCLYPVLNIKLLTITTHKNVFATIRQNKIL